MVVASSCECSRAISTRVSWRKAASKFDNGSSNKNTSGFLTIARPIATRWRCPPDNAAGLRSRRCSIWRILAAASTRVLISAFDKLWRLKEKAIF